MDYQQYVNQLDSETVSQLQEAVEIGKWSNGDKLTKEQTDNAIQAVMLWKASHEVARVNEPFKVNDNGEFSVGKGSKLKETPLEFQSKDNLELIFSSKT
ncbi:MAG: hypothetical protein ACJAS9_001655 [Polaribacter sp.]|jgi:uncharacterized protein YeaC (DUF1315 family)